MKKAQSPRLESVRVVSGLAFSATFSDGKEVVVDMGETVSSLEAFAPLENPAEFASAKVTDWGWTLEWDCGASLGSGQVIEMALEQSGMVENARFRRWQDANGLSLTDAAQALSLTRRTVSKYRTGASPVPAYIGLACIGWETLRARKLVLASASLSARSEAEAAALPHL